MPITIPYLSLTRNVSVYNVVNSNKIHRHDQAKNAITGYTNRQHVFNERRN